MSATRFPADLAALAPLRDLVKQRADAAGLSTSRGYRLMLAVDEVATNIVLHGYQENGLEGHLDVSVEVTEDNELVVCLEDDAVAFDPRSLEGPDAEDLSIPLEERDEGGLGIMLAMDGVDRFDYERVGERNRNTFAVRLKE
ncbi:ATP-binding protein [Pararhodospirillum oryzae]|uniref:Histidine kinase n=1 Tax=Pararhodospirillum oryzae TaxID=478448 RepID=A0A512H7C6_9PROT|nr:ATP-binding protein [Pararhodospirillum oryzae]GEO81280.1 histidine kinase [Pararhodospirillum oryzae]